MNCLQSMVALLRPIGAYSLRPNSLVFYELLSYYEGLKLIEDELAVLRDEGFVQTAQGFGLRRWEEIIRSTAMQSDNLQGRRDVVLYTLSRMPWDFNSSGMVRGLRSLGLACSISENTAAQAVTVDVESYSGSLQTYEEVLKRVCAILPAHVSVALNMGDVTWDSFDAQGQNFEERDAADLTWDAFESSAVTPNGGGV